jgi:hypothetical protein
MRNMLPMGSNFTHFISYHDIRIDDIDLIDDAWGFSSSFRDVINLLGDLNIVAGQDLTDKLIRRIREHH